MKKPLIGRPTFDVRRVRAGNRELGVWLAWLDVSNMLGSQRSILATRFHEAFGFAQEARPLDQYIKRGYRAIDRAWEAGRGEDEFTKALEGHIAHIKEYAFLASNTSQRGAESLVHTVDSIIKYAGASVNMAGKSDQYLIGGRYLADELTLLEGFRIVANWQRHHLEWRRAVFNEANYNHRGLKALGLWGKDNVPLQFIKSLRRRSYFELDQDIHLALEYLVCEMGMRHSKTE